MTTAFKGINHPHDYFMSKADEFHMIFQQRNRKEFIESEKKRLNRLLRKCNKGTINFDMASGRLAALEEIKGVYDNA
jgi:hypothetical protein